MESGQGFWFTSTSFEAEAGEDEETNPRMYGRQVAQWVRERFSSAGYPVEDVIPEDWGWCVMCQREPFSLMVGCVNLRDHEHAEPDDPPPARDRLLWNAIPMAETPFLKYVFKRKPDTAPALARLEDELKAFLESEPTIELVDASVADRWFEDADS